MIVNQANLHGLTVGYSTAFNKSFDTTQSNYQKVATVVPSTTGEQDYKWLGQMPGMREWIGRSIRPVKLPDLACGFVSVHQRHHNVTYYQIHRFLFKNVQRLDPIFRNQYMIQ